MKKTTFDHIFSNSTIVSASGAGILLGSWLGTGGAVAGWLLGAALGFYNSVREQP